MSLTNVWTGWALLRLTPLKHTLGFAARRAFAAEDRAWIRAFSNNLKSAWKQVKMASHTSQVGTALGRTAGLAWVLVGLFSHACGNPLGKPGALRMPAQSWICWMRISRVVFRDRSKWHMLWMRRSCLHHFVCATCSPKYSIWTSLGRDLRSGVTMWCFREGALVQHLPFCCESKPGLSLRRSFASTTCSIVWKMAWKSCLAASGGISSWSVKGPTSSHGIGSGFRHTGTGSCAVGMLNLAVRTEWSGKTV